VQEVDGPNPETGCRDGFAGRDSLYPTSAKIGQIWGTPGFLYTCRGYDLDGWSGMQLAPGLKDFCAVGEEDHSGIEKFVDVALDRPRGLELSLDEFSFYRFALERILEADFAIHKSSDSTLESRVAFPIFLKGCQINLQASLFGALLV
jgi:hypothetical protein